MIYHEGFEAMQRTLQNAVSFPYLLTLVAFEHKALQLSRQSLSLPSLLLLSALINFFCGPQPFCYDYEIPIF